MIKLIVGSKGSGKTKAMIDMINNSVKTTNGNIIVVEKGMKLTFDIDHAARLIDLDEYKVNGGEITITCTVSNGTATVAVCDNGPGIRPEHLSRVFEPFFTTKPVGEGTGLGLYVSYNLAQELGGRIEVENRPQVGACFSLHFPSEGRGDV